MKTSIFIFYGAVALSSCAYNDLPISDDGFRIDHGCVNVVEIRAGAHGISQSNWSGLLTDLLVQNKVAFDNLRFTKFDDADHLNKPDKKYVHVTAEQFVNELPVFRAPVGLHFLNGELYLTLGHRYEATIPRLDLEKRLDGSIIRGLYFQEMENHNLNRRAFNVNCLDIQFGYLDLNRGSSVLTPENLVKAWFVRPSDEEYPLALFLDDDGATAHFFDGIVN